MPKWATSAAFSVFLSYIKGEPLCDLDMSTAQRLLWLSDFFKIDDMTEMCIKKLVVPRLSKDNVLSFIDDSYLKISSSSDEGQANEAWSQLLSECLDVAARHLHFLVRTVGPRVAKLDPVVLEELIERAFKIAMENPSTDNAPIIDMLLHIRDMQDPFDLLENERLKVLEKERAYYSSGEASPNLTWNLSNLRGNFYRESEPFFVIGCYWVLSIWSYKQDGTVSIAIKQSKTPKEVEEQLNSSVLSKERLFSSPAKKKDVTPTKSRLDVNKLLSSPDASAQAEGKIPNHCILTSATFVHINQLDEEGEGTFQLASLISAAKAPTVMRVITIDELNQLGGQLSIEIYLKLEHTHSGILTFISKNFNWLYNNPHVGRLTKNQFLVLLKHKHLNIKREEDALVALCIWCIIFAAT